MLKNIRLSMKLAIGFGLLLILLFIALGVVYWGNETIKEAAVETIDEDAAVVALAGHARANTGKLRGYEKDIISNLEASDYMVKFTDYKKKWNYEQEQLQARLDEIRKLAKGKEDKRMIDAMKNDLAVYESAMKSLMLKIEAKQTQNVSETDRSLIDAKDNIQAVENSVVTLSERANERILQAGTRVKAVIKKIKNIIIAIAVISIVVGVLILNSMKHMTAKLRDMIGDIKATSSQLAAATDEICSSTIQITKGAEFQASSTEQTSSTMVEMASQIDNVAKNAQALATNVDETSSSVQELGTSIEQVAKNSETLLASVDETSTTIEQMGSSIKAVSEKLRVVDSVSKDAARIASQSGDDLTRVIASIGVSIKDIGKIMKLIEEIADQTNLLALNAAIEAARAGEAGKGFAVVAEEVKRLAERTMHSTREIAIFIETVQKDTTQAVDLSGSVLKQIADSVSKATGLVGEVYTAAQEQAIGATQIIKTATNMQNITRQVTSAAREQAGGAKEIMKAVESMNRMTQHVADATVEQKKGGDMIVKAMEQISKVSGQNLSATEQLSKATMGLAKESQRLQKTTEMFKV